LPVFISAIRYFWLPEALATYQDKLFGLTIDPYRLQQIRQERYTGDTYASAQTCQFEVAQAEALYRAAGVIGAYILHKASLRRKI